MSKVYNGSEIVERRIGDMEISASYYGERLVWQAGNFRTADGFIFQTADNKVFNVKE